MSLFQLISTQDTAFDQQSSAKPGHKLPQTAIFLRIFDVSYMCTFTFIFWVAVPFTFILYIARHQLCYYYHISLMSSLSSKQMSRLFSDYVVRTIVYYNNVVVYMGCILLPLNKLNFYFISQISHSLAYTIRRAFSHISRSLLYCHILQAPKDHKWTYVSSRTLYTVV